MIGYGNTLRGDDGAGYRLAERVADWGLGGVTAWPCHQLTPDLAADLARVDRVIFADASLPQNPVSPLRLERMQGNLNSPGVMGHHSQPGQVLTLGQQLYGCQPIAYTLTLPAQQMDYGEQLSPWARAGLLQAERLLWQLLNRPERPGASPPTSGGEPPPLRRFPNGC